MFTKEEVSNQIVRVKTKTKDQLGLFECSSISVGEGMAGTFLDDGEGSVIPLANMIEIVDAGEASEELGRWSTAKDKLRIAEVVKSVDSSQQEFSGTIVLQIGFRGSLPKTKALTRAEKEMISKSFPVITDDPEAEKERKALLKKLGQYKPLFESEEYDAIEQFKASRRKEFENLGIPFPMGNSMHLIRITSIPKAEDLIKRTHLDLAALVKKLQGVYPEQIKPEAVGLGVLYNAGDYRSPDALEGMFKFVSKYMHFGVPDILQEISPVLWKQEMERTREVWEEARALGRMGIRMEFAKIVTTLVAAVSPGKEGEKKRFYATAVTNLTDFFEVFNDRNMAGDKDLEAEVEKLRDLVAGRTVEEFKTDDKLRSFVQKEGAKIQESLEEMLVESSARTISFQD